MGRFRGRSAQLFRLSAAELAWLFPSPTTVWFGGPEHGAPTIQPIWLGADSEGAPAAVWLDPTEGRHLLVLGETGMGKSTLLVRVIAQGCRDAGAILLDPIGDTALRVLESLPPSARARVLWIAPVSSPVGINALASLRTDGIRGGLSA
ncbi:MAG: ATP-binding protein, partial [Thermoplasmata archaeon]|nr:ATP-binding protein [Thermoplasmata archaeon]